MLDDNQKLRLQEMIKANNTEDTTNAIREVKHSQIIHSEVQELGSGNSLAASQWETLFVSGGRKDKISKGDIAGLFFKQGSLKSTELGAIELTGLCLCCRSKKKGRSAYS